MMKPQSLAFAAGLLCLLSVACSDAEGQPGPAGPQAPTAPPASPLAQATSANVAATAQSTAPAATPTPEPTQAPAIQQAPTAPAPAAPGPTAPPPAVAAPPASTATPTAEPPSRPPPVTVAMTLNLADRSFTPHQVHGNAGDTVALTFTSATEAHTFTVTSLGIDVSIPARETKLFSFVMPVEGEVPFYCRLHGSPTAGMHGLLIFH